MIPIAPTAVLGADRIRHHGPPVRRDDADASRAACLLHHADSMFLDRAKLDAHFGADLLADQPGNQPPEYFELSWRELCKSCAAFHHLSGACKRPRHGAEEFVIPKGL